MITNVSKFVAHDGTRCALGQWDDRPPISPAASA